MTTKDECPALEMLVQFNEGQLDSTELNEVSDHILACARCVSILDELQLSNADSTVDEVRRCFQLPPLTEETAWAQLAVAAQSLGGRTYAKHSTGAARDAEDDGGSSFTPREIGPYLLLEVIGKGGMGIVYRAQQLALNRVVAVKMILGGATASAQAVSRFRTEGKAIARLHHPNVVEIYDFGEHYGLPYYSMELVEGGSLAGKLAKGALPLRDAAELVQTLANAVESAHQRGVLHRDLKPANVLLTSQNRPKISDFGLAKLLDGDSSQTHSEVIMGTPSYMAPEQAEGQTKAIGAAADVYSLGAILYETLTGRPPFKGDTPAQTRAAVRSVEPTPPSRLRRKLPSSLEAICLKCLEKKPASRYPSAQTLADDLGRWLQGRRPKEISSRLVRLLRSHKRSLTVALGIALVAGLTTFFVQGPDAALGNIMKDLKEGRPVTLVGETGEPKWFKVLNGDDKTKRSLGDDQTFSLHTWSMCLLELLPETLHDSYCFKAKVRHRASIDLAGEVGLFFAHKAYPQARRDAHLFLRLTFNDIRAYPGTFAPAVAKAKLPEQNTVNLLPHFYAVVSDRWTCDIRMGGKSEPKFTPAGGSVDRWRDLEVVVTPDKVSCQWDGQPAGDFSVAWVVKQIAGDLAGVLARGQPGDAILSTIPAEVTLRGGLGLYLTLGSASFREVSITPLNGSGAVSNLLED